jgi:hypothetical protein
LFSLVPGWLSLSGSLIWLVDQLDSSALSPLLTVSFSIANTPSGVKHFQQRSERLIHMEQLQQVELFDGRAAMIGI